MHGAFAGIVGTVLIGTIASALGGTARLISAPCAPAAAVLSAFALDMMRRGDDPGVIVLLLVLIGVLAGLLQVGLGLLLSLIHIFSTYLVFSLHCRCSVT